MRRLRCSASVDVGVVVPPPLSLIPRVVLRQVSDHASCILQHLMEDDPSSPSCPDASLGTLTYDIVRCCLAPVSLHCAWQGASVILSTIVTTLVNRFLDLLMQDYQKWALDDGSRANGSLLGYQPDMCVVAPFEASCTPILVVL